MKFHLEPRPPAPVTPRVLAAELAERCYPALAHKPWPARRAALAEMHDQLRDDMADAAAFRATFPLFVALLVERFGTPPIRDRAQAGIYANSARAAHRRAAAAARASLPSERLPSERR